MFKASNLDQIVEIYCTKAELVLCMGKERSFNGCDLVTVKHTQVVSGIKIFLVSGTFFLTEKSLFVAPCCTQKCI